MLIRKLIYKIKPPCLQCPYRQGVIKTVISPCPQCKLNGYRAFEQFQRQLSRTPPATAWIRKSLSEEPIKMLPNILVALVEEVTNDPKEELPI